MTTGQPRREGAIPGVALLPALVGLVLAACHEIPPTLERACSDDPLVRECRTEGCATAFECVAYCIERYPESLGVPATGTGSWCDEPELGDLGGLCAAHDDIEGCLDWCAGHPGRCGGGDGDADGDGDVDSDGDGDADGDADGDGDTEPECGDHGDCLDPAAAQCLDGACAACADHDHCAGIPDRAVCREGVCVECSETSSSCPEALPHCDDIVWRCVACSVDEHCADASRSRCDRVIFECLPCDRDRDCEELDGRPICEEGTCVQCLEDDHTSCTAAQVCNDSSHLCVEACRPCERDADCGDLEGFSCVADSMGNRSCFQAAPGEGCVRPWTRVERPGDGGTGANVAVCAPPDTTTCLGIVELGDACDPEDATPCGHDAFGVDAVCPADQERCTYMCTDGELTRHSEWCPDGSICAIDGFCTIP